jgi:hypothetical protein
MYYNSFFLLLLINIINILLLFSLLLISASKAIKVIIIKIIIRKLILKTEFNFVITLLIIVFKTKLTSLIRMTFAGFITDRGRIIKTKLL